MSTETDVERMQEFIHYAASLRGDEKGEAQVFCDRFFQAFGHKGYKEAGATLEFRVKAKGKSTKFADLLWKPRLLLEMKKKGEKLQHHYSQASEYWFELVPHRPKYVVLCNFEEFWIYDFDIQMEEPIDIVRVDELADRFTVLNFMFPEEREPQFGNNRVDVTRAAADRVANVFNLMVARGETREQAQRFVLQCVVAMFSEDADLLPLGLFSELINDCKKGKASTYDAFGSLFQQMNTATPAKAGRFKNVRYFNGGVFKIIEPIELRQDELSLLSEAAQENWSKVQPAIFGTLFEGSMNKSARHAFGAHFTSEADIQKVVIPTIVRPWRERIDAAGTLKELKELLDQICKFRVLDPACGSGNFLYVAYRELMRLEMTILARIHSEFGDKAKKAVGTHSLVSTKQFFGLDVNAFAVELAKVTLMLAKELAIKEAHAWIETARDSYELPLTFGAPLPLDNLDDNIRCCDALFTDWPKTEAIIGNPPYQSKNKMQQEFGPRYVNRLRAAYPEMPGKADFCVYWFRKAHEVMEPGARAGLVGTNTVRQNYSREGGLDYIVGNGGTITEAVSSQAWSGDAAVHVSIVNWVKAPSVGLKKLYNQVGDASGPWSLFELETIGPALSENIDVTSASSLRINSQSTACFQGQTHGHEGFLLTPEVAAAMIAADSKNSEVIFPYLTADELFASQPTAPQRFAIDFHSRDVLESREYKLPFQRIESLVLKDREAAALNERKRNSEVRAENPSARVNRHHENFLNRWWLFSYPRPELITKVSGLERYIVCGQVMKRPIFEFISSEIRPNAALIVFPMEDDYSFGILQSVVHWIWILSRCSTLTERFRYTSDTVFDSFPWPQSPNEKQVREVAGAAVEFRELRRQLMAKHGWSLRELYRTMDQPGQNPLRDKQEALNRAVKAAYGFKTKDVLLQALLKLNLQVAEKESSLKKVTGPGLPSGISGYVTTDCVRPLT